jgi:hypothetical protein
VLTIRPAWLIKRRIRETSLSDVAGTHHLGLGLPLTLAQEQFSKAFILSIASLAGCGAAIPEPTSTA